MKRYLLFIALFFFSFSQRQETTLVFIHGLNQDANFWGEMAESVKNETNSGNVVNISYGNKTEMKTKTMDELTEAFAEQLILENSNGNLKQNLIFVAHSFGGLVARNYVRKNGLYKDRIIATITIGTPHQGAPGALVTKEEMKAALSTHMKYIVEADIARKTNWFVSLFASAYSLLIDAMFGVDIPGIIDNVVSSTVNGKIAAQVDEGPVYKDIYPESPALNTLNSNKNDGILYYTLSGDERFPLFWRVAGNSIEVNNASKEIFSSLLSAKNITDELSAKTIYYKRHRAYDNGDVWYNWFNGTQSAFRNGHRSIAGINKSYTGLVKAYRIQFFTGNYWQPCDDYFDDDVLTDGPEPRVSLFSTVSERAPDCVSGYWVTYSYQVHHSYKNDGLVPTWHAQLYPANDPDGAEAKENDHYNSHQHNHTQIGRKKGLWAKPGNDTEVVTVLGGWFSFLLTNVEKVQDNDTYDKTVSLIKLDIYTDQLGWIQ
jgi:pimeloyl-ACP methyl ester carboxylesterase